MSYSEIHRRKPDIQEHSSSDDSDLEAYRSKGRQSFKTLQVDQKQKMLQYIQDHMDENEVKQQQAMDGDELMKQYYARPPELNEPIHPQINNKIIPTTPTKQKTQKKWFEFLPESRQNQQNKTRFISPFRPESKTHGSTTPTRTIGSTTPSQRVKQSTIHLKTPPPKIEDKKVIQTPKPTINSKSQKLVEKRFQRETQDKNSPSYQFFSKKEASVQTTESIPNERRKATKIISSKSKITTKKCSTVNNQTIVYAEMGIQTSPKIYKESKKFLTPIKSQTQNEENQSRTKQSQPQQYSYYQPIHQRYQLEIEKKKLFLEKGLKLKQEQEDLVIAKTKKQSKKEDDDEDRINEFSTTQLKWQQKRQNDAYKKRMISQSKENEEFTYRPKILPKSERMAKTLFKNKGNLKTEDRLMEFQYNKEIHHEELTVFNIKQFKQSPQSKRINKRKYLQNNNLNKSTMEFQTNDPLDLTHSNMQTFYVGDEDDDKSDQHNFSWL